MEDYPSLAEGNGLENRQVGKTARGFESHIFLHFKHDISVGFNVLSVALKSSGVHLETSLGVR